MIQRLFEDAHAALGGGCPPALCALRALAGCPAIDGDGGDVGTDDVFGDCGNGFGVGDGVGGGFGAGEGFSDGFTDGDGFGGGVSGDGFGFDGG